MEVHKHPKLCHQHMLAACVHSRDCLTTFSCDLEALACSAEDPHCLKRLGPMPLNLPKRRRPHLEPSQCPATPRRGLGAIATMAPPKVHSSFGALMPAG